MVAVVDNDPAMLKALNRLLSAYGHHVETFTSAEAFLNSSSARDAACLVLDIHLDGMSGLELQRMLSDAGSSIPVIFMTGFDTPASKEEALQAGCIEYLRKPFESSALINAIRKAAA